MLVAADDLKLSDQGRLLDWLSAGPQSPRLIATASRPLSPLVEAGAFSRSLYNRGVYTRGGRLMFTLTFSEW